MRMWYSIFTCLSLELAILSTRSFELLMTTSLCRWIYIGLQLARRRSWLVACSGFLFRFLAVLVLHTAPILGNVSSATSWSRERKKASCDAGFHRCGGTGAPA